MIAYINHHCPQCRVKHSMKGKGRTVRRIFSEQPFGRILADYIDLQRFSTQKEAKQLEDLEREEKRLAELMKQPINNTPSVQRSHHDVVCCILSLRRHIDNLINTGERSPYRYILSIKDHFSRYCWLFPTKDKSCATTAGKIYLFNIFSFIYICNFYIFCVFLFLSSVFFFVFKSSFVVFLRSIRIQKFFTQTMAVSLLVAKLFSYVKKIALGLFMVAHIIRRVKVLLKFLTALLRKKFPFS
jgi:hypothetical protein